MSGYSKKRAVSMALGDPSAGSAPALSSSSTSSSGGCSSAIGGERTPRGRSVPAVAAPDERARRLGMAPREHPLLEGVPRDGDPRLHRPLQGGLVDVDQGAAGHEGADQE